MRSRVTSRKEMGIQVDKLSRGQQGTLAATKADHTLGCMSRSAANSLAEMIIPCLVAARHMSNVGSLSAADIDQLQSA